MISHCNVAKTNLISQPVPGLLKIVVAQQSIEKYSIYTCPNFTYMFFSVRLTKKKTLKIIHM